MKAYGDLTLVGKLRRLRGLAGAALAQYELAVARVSYFGWHTNLLYRIDTVPGERLMLRLAYPGWRTADDLRSEAIWLGALARDTSIPVPRVMTARAGEAVLPVSLPGVPAVWHATLMSWVPGRLLGSYLTERNLGKMGELFAELHHHGAAWRPPAGFTTRRFEHWLSRGEDNLIVGGGPAGPGGGAGMALPAQAAALVDRLHERVEAAYAAVDRADLRVIHCDLWHDNIKLHQGALHPLDFEDTVWGFRAHDIAMAMLDLLETIDDDRYPELLGAFRRGYEVHLSWPEERLEPFMVGRLLWKLNWFARRLPQRLPGAVEAHMPVFEHFERTGRLVRPPAV